MKEGAGEKDRKRTGLRQHLGDVILRKLLHEALFRRNKFLSEFQFLLLQRKYFFLHSIPRDEFVRLRLISFLL